MEWFNSLDYRVQAAIIGAIVSILAIFIKDYFFAKINERQKVRQSKLTTLKLYSNPMIRANETLCWRLKEILENRGAFLLNPDSVNEFFEYKYKSTLYRLSALIGWVRAIYREFAYIETSKRATNREIEDAFIEFQSALADGQHTELSILNGLTKYWNIDVSKLSNDDKAKLAIKIEDIIYNKVDTKKVFIANKLSKEEQTSLLCEILDCICDFAECKRINNDFLQESLVKSINEISRIEAWIYRDWQIAIGDFMLKEMHNAPRRYDIMGYGEFEEFFKKENQWILRLKRVFDNLNVEVDDRLDARIGQLKRIYKASLQLLIVFNKVNKDQETISETSIKKLNEFSHKL
jgi:hypothetical protein